MKQFECRALFAICLISSLRVVAAEQEPLQVLLQGASSSQIAKLVIAAGGNVTHDLHIIDAVGARLSPDQLRTVVESPLVTRYIDDLAITDEPGQEPHEEDCKVRGHIELDITPSGFRWPLYNKREAPVELETLNMAWPERLGVVTAMSLGGEKLPAELYRDSISGALQIEFPEARRPRVETIADLDVSFSAAGPAVSAPPRQRDFSIKAGFGECFTDLVPGYERNHEDFYYNRVAGIEALHRQGITGKGITVAVVDSGLWEHEALRTDTRGENRLVARYDAILDRSDVAVLDESGHGTHMSSIIFNSAPTTQNGLPTGTYKGVAPDANLVAVKVLDREGLAHVLEIVRAIQWVVDNRDRYSIRVLNLSFAQTPRWPFWEDPVNQAVTVAWSRGIAVVAAAGNEGPDADTVGSPGNLPYIITVGAVTDSWTPGTRDDDYIPDFSSRGPTPTGHVKPDIVALGGHMTGLIYPDSAIALQQPEDMLRTGEFVSTGSSQASALVSGILALLLQLHPEATPEELKCRLITSAEPAINRDGQLAYSPFQQGYGYVTATRAVTLGQPACDLPFPLSRVNPQDESSYLGPALVGDNGEALLPGYETLISATVSEKGLSDTRRWGVKEHIERLQTENLEQASPAADALEWEALYTEEKAAINRLARDSADD